MTLDVEWQPCLQDDISNLDIVSVLSDSMRIGVVCLTQIPVLVSDSCVQSPIAEPVLHMRPNDPMSVQQTQLNFCITRKCIEPTHKDVSAVFLIELQLRRLVFESLCCFI